MTDWVCDKERVHEVCEACGAVVGHGCPCGWMDAAPRASEECHCDCEACYREAALVGPGEGAR